MTLAFLLPLIALLWTAPHASNSLVIHDVAVVDVENGSVAMHRDVGIRGEKVISVVPVGKPLTAARVIAGRGKFLIPGLWDMHVHLWNKDPRFALYLANGVTGIRDMGSNFAQVCAWRKQILSGALAGPRIFTSGPPLNGPDEKTDPRLSARMVQGPEEARRAFDELDDMHVDFIEVLPGLRPEAYFALTEFTRHWGHRVAGNLPDDVSAMDAVNARQGSIEDLEGILISCSSEERDLRKQWRHAKHTHDLEGLEKSVHTMVETYSERKAARIFADMRIYQVMATPLLTARRRDAIAGAAKLEYDRLGLLVKAMGSAGVNFLAGTDSGMDDTSPGFELHDELELMARAGLTPAQVLRAATLHPARTLRQESTLGEVGPQHDADLVLLEGNPLTDISNTRKIAGVFVNGRYFAKSELSLMLSRENQQEAR